jgi:GR25 family glycosyltransferase involved in LPS biosynthesis
MFSIYYINLEHRHDRLEHIQKEIQKISPSFLNKVERIPAIYTPHLGILGCGLSHEMALEKFITDVEPENDNIFAVLFEDDFEFIDEETRSVFENVYKYFKMYPDMNVFLLAANILKVGESISGFDCVRILQSQAHSGYIIRRSYAPILLEIYKESNHIIRKCNYSNHPYCFDVYIQHFQENSGWYAFKSKTVGKQRPDYSDIQNKIVNHGC